MEEFKIYKKMRMLNKAIHRHLHLMPMETDFSFAQATNSVVLGAMEFAYACMEYPIIFTRSKAQILPAALLGLRSGENLFVDDQGVWQARYIPSFFRRYPFVLAEGFSHGGSLVYIDEAYPGFTTKEEGLPLFDAQGEFTPVLQNAIDFISEFQGQLGRTELFVNRLQEWGLLVELSARVASRSGTQYAMEGLLIVDENQLQALAPDRLLELFRGGELQWVYAHLFSLANLNRLATFLEQRNAR
ncbi:MAG: SapC family protein [Magnetococcales bacterium]|nr:SapC family protein [Magnetococcales bacterium]